MFNLNNNSHKHNSDYNSDYNSNLEHFIATKLSNSGWRLNNLYSVVDKEDNVVKFSMNDAQVTVHSVKHPKTIILKSRQRGISTYKVLENLDKCIFNPNSQTGVQSYGQSEAKKLYKKALFAWDNLDPDIKELLDIKLVTSNAEGMYFSNGSSFKVGNFRGDTLSSLHVSELAKIARKYPEKAEELNTGAFEAVSTNSSISIESTAEGNSGLFYDMWKTAELRLSLVGEDNLTPLDFYPIFLSWVDDSDCSMDEYYEATPDDIEYFSKVEKDLNIKLTQQQKNWCAAKRSRLQDKFQQEYPHNPEAAFNVPVEGTYYQVQYNHLLSNNRIKPNYGYNPSLTTPIAVFDLGMNDDMAITIWQIDKSSHKYYLIDEYSNNGQSIGHYMDVLATRPYRIAKVVVPHDANVRELSTGRTRIEEFRKYISHIQVVPKLSLQDGINATRLLLVDTYINSACISSIASIQNYRKKYDKKFNVYLDKPEHDEHSHFADSIRYAALVLRTGTLLNSYDSYGV